MKNSKKIGGRPGLSSLPIPLVTTYQNMLKYSKDWGGKLPPPMVFHYI